MPKFYGELQQANLENLASDPSGTSAGRVWHNTTEVRVKTDDGTNKRALLRNDAKCVVGNSGTASENVRFHRGAANLIQFVTGDDATAEGTRSTSLNQISGKLENYTDAGKPSVGNAGRAVWTTDVNRIQVDTGSEFRNVVATGSGSPAITKGDLVVGDGTNHARLAVGSNDFVLAADSSTLTGLKWASAASIFAESKIYFFGYVNSQTISGTTTVQYNSGLDSQSGWSGAANYEYVFDTSGNYIIAVTADFNGANASDGDQNIVSLQLDTGSGYSTIRTVVVELGGATSSPGGAATLFWGQTFSSGDKIRVQATESHTSTDSLRTSEIFLMKID